MASSHSASPGPRRGPNRPNTAFRRLRGTLSPGEFAAAVRRSAREIGEQVACDARYIGRVEAGEIQCPNYAYERVFLHMFPGHSLADMGFADREFVRGRAARTHRAYGGDPTPSQSSARAADPLTVLTQRDGQGRPYLLPEIPRPHGPCDLSGLPVTGDPGDPTSHNSLNNLYCPACSLCSHCAACSDCPENHEESDVLRRAFMTSGTAAALALPLGIAAPASAAGHRRVGETEAGTLEQAVQRIRVLDDQHGADSLFAGAGDSLRAAYELLDNGTAHRQRIAERLHRGTGELAISVGWLAHDSGHFDAARSHYAEALATARVAADPALEAHAFCNTAFLARDTQRPREALRAAQAGAQAARHLGSARLLSLLSLREAGGWAGLGDRTGCRQALRRAYAYFARGPAPGADPAWMSFFGEAELAGLEAQCWSLLHDWKRAAEGARRAVALQEPHFVRNRALFTAELAGDLAALGQPEEAAEAGAKALELLGPVQSSRIRTMLDATARRLRPHAGEGGVATFLDQLDQLGRLGRPGQQARGAGGFRTA